MMHPHCVPLPSTSSQSNTFTVIGAASPAKVSDVLASLSCMSHGNGSAVRAVAVPMDGRGGRGRGHLLHPSTDRRCTGLALYLLRRPIAVPRSFSPCTSAAERTPPRISAQPIAVPPFRRQPALPRTAIPAVCFRVLTPDVHPVRVVLDMLPAPRRHACGCVGTLQHPAP